MISVLSALTWNLLSGRQRLYCLEKACGRLVHRGRILPEVWCPSRRACRPSFSCGRQLLKRFELCLVFTGREIITPTGDWQRSAEQNAFYTTLVALTAAEMRYRILLGNVDRILERTGRSKQTNICLSPSSSPFVWFHEITPFSITAKKGAYLRCQNRVRHIVP